MSELTWFFSDAALQAAFISALLWVPTERRWASNMLHGYTKT